MHLHAPSLIHSVLDSLSQIAEMVFLLIAKTRWRPWPIRQIGGILYSGALYVAFWSLV